jgi:hypothetical protein
MAELLGVSRNPLFSQETKITEAKLCEIGWFSGFLRSAETSEFRLDLMGNRGKSGQQ